MGAESWTPPPAKRHRVAALRRGEKPMVSSVNPEQNTITFPFMPEMIVSIYFPLIVKMI